MPRQVPALLEVSPPGPQEWQAGPCLERLGDSATWPGDPWALPRAGPAPDPTQGSLDAPRDCPTAEGGAGLCLPGVPGGRRNPEPESQPSWRARRAGPGAPPAPHTHREQPPVQQQRQQQRARRPLSHGPAGSARSLARRPPEAARSPACGVLGTARPAPAAPTPPAARPPRPAPRPAAPPPGARPHPGPPRPAAPGPAPGPPPDRPRTAGAARWSPSPRRSQLGLCLGPQPPRREPRPSPAPRQTRPGVRDGTGPCAPTPAAAPRARDPSTDHTPPFRTRRRDSSLARPEVRALSHTPPAHAHPGTFTHTPSWPPPHLSHSRTFTPWPPGRLSSRAQTHTWSFQNCHLCR